MPLPTLPLTRFGYDTEFDADAKYANYTMDFAVITEHLYQPHLAAKAHGAGIALVIFEPHYLPRYLSRRGAWLKANLPLMKGQAWVRHDERYHVDFAVPCRSLAT